MTQEPLIVNAANEAVESAARCRLCGSLARLVGARADVRLAACQRCAFVSGFPTQQLEAKHYDGYHAGPAPADPIARYDEWLSRAEAELGVGRLLEVGAGRGGLVRQALSRGWIVSATELSSVGLSALRSMGVDFFAGDLLDAPFPERSYDLVVALELLEHIPDPTAYLRRLALLARPGGLLLLTTPNYGGLTRRMLGMRWRVIAAEHLGYFTASTLKPALVGAGFVPLAVVARSLDVTSWRRSQRRAVPEFNPHASAKLRDAVEHAAAFRLLREFVNGVLRISGLGDSLVAWARRSAELS